MDFDHEAMTLIACGTTASIMNIDNQCALQGNDCASIMNYKDPKRAIKRHVDPEWQTNAAGATRYGGYNAVATL